MQLEINSTFLDRYSVREEVGTGSFGKVYRLQHLHKSKAFALKIDIRQKGNVLLEAKVLSDLQGGAGIPKLHRFGTTDSFSYMIVELLGPTLSALMKETHGKFSLRTVIGVMLQLIARIELVHKKGYLHRDLKPHQILIGKNKRLVYLTDFGLARKFEVNNYHITYQNSCPRVGNATFSSLNNHSGVRVSRRDDLESLSYMAFYMLKGGLPWQTTNKLTSNSRWQSVFQIKNNCNIDELCTGCPKEFGIFLKYCRNLKFEEKPDYAYISSLFTQIAQRESLSTNYFDWLDTSPSTKLLRLSPLDSTSQSISRPEVCRDLQRRATLNINFGNIDAHDRSRHGEKKRRKKRSKTQVNQLNGENDESMIPSHEKEKEELKIEEMLDAEAYYNLDTTPKNILPEMKNRSIIKEHQAIRWPLIDNSKV